MKSDSEQKPEIERVNAILDKFLEVHRTQNINLLSEIFSHDPEMINFGSDLDEVFYGWDALKESFLNQFKSFEKTEVSYRNRSIKVSKTLQNAWYSEILDFSIIINGNQVNIKDFRHSGTLENRENGWVIVQFHYAVPVIGQAAEY
jgi:hypothetical protein